MKWTAILYLPVALLVVLVTIAVGVTLTISELGKLKDHEFGFLVSGSDLLLSALVQPINHLKGLLVLNVRAQFILDHLRRNVRPGHEQHLMLLNPAGYRLMAPNPDDAGSSCSGGRPHWPSGTPPYGRASPPRRKDR